MRKIFLVSLAISICLSMIGCSKLTGLFSESDPNDRRGASAEQTLEFDHYVQDGTVVNGYISNGDGSLSIKPSDQTGNTGATLAPSQQPTQEATTPPADTNQLVGNWNTVSRTGNYLIPHTITFNADGTFYEYSSEWTHTSYDPQLFAGSEPGWKPLPMGFPGWYGTYSVEGSTITMVTLGDDVGYECEPVTNTLTIESLDSSTATFSGRRYLKNFTPSNSDQYIEELCTALGVDLSV